MTVPASAGFYLTRLGHSCVVIGVGQPDGTQRRLVLDPGNLTPPLTSAVGRVDAVLVTHAHGDHVDADQIWRLRESAHLPVYGDGGVRSLLAEAGIEDTEVLAPGRATVGGIAVHVSTAEHEPIYPGVAVPGNLAYLLAGTVFAPGDAFFVPDFDVDVLLLATGAPWMKLADTVDYLRAVAPRVAVPLHDGGLTAAHQNLHRGLITKFAPDGTTVVTPGLGEQIDLATLETTGRGRD